MFKESDDRYYYLEREKNNSQKKEIKNNLSKNDKKFKEYNNFCSYLDKVYLNKMGFNIKQVKLDAVMIYDSQDSFSKIMKLNNNSLILKFLVLLNGNYSAMDIILLSKYFLDEKIINKLYSIKVNNFEFFIEKLFYTIIIRKRLLKITDEKNMDIDKCINSLADIYNEEQADYYKPPKVEKIKLLSYKKSK